MWNIAGSGPQMVLSKNLHAGPLEPQRLRGETVAAPAAWCSATENCRHCRTTADCLCASGGGGGGGALVSGRRCRDCQLLVLVLVLLLVCCCFFALTLALVQSSSRYNWLASYD